jgi:hypothetical protein
MRGNNDNNNNDDDDNKRLELVNKELEGVKSNLAIAEGEKEAAIRKEQEAVAACAQVSTAAEEKVEALKLRLEREQRDEVRNKENIKESGC